MNIQLNCLLFFKVLVVSRFCVHSLADYFLFSARAVRHPAPHVLREGTTSERSDRANRARSRLDAEKADEEESLERMLEIKRRAHCTTFSLDATDDDDCGTCPMRLETIGDAPRSIGM